MYIKLEVLVKDFYFWNNVWIGAIYLNNFN